MTDADEQHLDATASLWDWRRRVSALYGSCRTLPPRAAWAAWREGRDELFRTHPQSPLDPGDRLAFPGLDLFPYDPALRFEVRLRPAPAGPPLIADVGNDGRVSMMAFARTDGLTHALGTELTLYWIGGYGGGVFLPFRDATTGEETYGGGRYLLDTIKGADLGQTEDGHQILDFNFAYNPSCVYSPRWVCPLSPTENHIPARITAGERRWEAPGG
jgi:uncharacterized protein (DUF1684 family)